MSAAIPVRTAGGQVIQVPPLRLSAASTHPKLVALMDRVELEVLGGRSVAPLAERLALCQEFIAEVCAWSKYEGEVEADVADVPRLHAAMRGIAWPDPTPADSAAGSAGRPPAPGA